MGYWGSYINGHSGTQRKHRKAFDKVKAYYKIKVSKNKFESYLNEKFSVPKIEKIKLSKSKLERIFRIGIFFLILIALGASIYFISPRDSYNSVVTQVNYLNSEIRATKSRAELKEVQENYSFLVKSGKSHLYSENLAEAQLEFKRALHYDKNGIEARTGLLKILELRCFDDEHSWETEETLALLNQFGITN